MIATSQFVLDYLTVAWSVLAVALVLGLIYSVVRIIPRREE